VGLAFVALVAVQLLWQRLEAAEEKASPRPRAERVVRRGNQGATVDDSTSLLLARELATLSGEADRARREEVEGQLNALTAGSVEQRRVAALFFEYQVDQTAEEALLKALHDEDSKVARRSAKALLSLWRHTDSPAVNRIFQQGLAAYKARDNEEAMEIFDSLDSLGRRIADLYRLRAELYLAQAYATDGKPDQALVGKALEDCDTALAEKQKNFMALYVQAKCHVAREDVPSALKSIDAALAIYPGLQEAGQLKAMIRPSE